LQTFLIQCFDTKWLEYAFVQHIETYVKSEIKSNKQKHMQWAFALKTEVSDLHQIFLKFVNQLINIIHTAEPNMQEILLERIEKSKDYFTPLLKKISAKIIAHIDEHKEDKKMKAYLKELLELDAHVFKQIQLIIKADAMLRSIVTNEEIVKDSSELAKANKAKKEEVEGISSLAKKSKFVYLPASDDDDYPKKTKKKKEKHDTKKESYDQYKSGKTVAQIAADRNMTEGTIEGHLAHYVSLKQIDVHTFVPQDKFKNIIAVIQEKKTLKLSEIKESLGEEYSYSDIRFTIAHFESE
jgi:uncharacterized protein YpbB